MSTPPDLDSVVAEQGAEIARLTEALATSRAEAAAAFVEGERLAKDLEAERQEVARRAAVLDTVRAERDRLRVQLRRAEAATYPALFLALGAVQDLTLTEAEALAIDLAISEADEPVALPCPACCLVDGVPSLRVLFRLGEELKKDRPPVAMWLRAPTPAGVSLGAGHEPGEAVEAAIMVRRVQS